MDQSTIIVGIDEAGRGPLAGPVVAAAVHLPCAVKRYRRGGWKTPDGSRLFDSKQLTPEEREEAYAWIVGSCPYGVSMVEACEIDTIGILESTNRAMQEALAQLCTAITPTYLLVDGRDAFWFDFPHSSLIGGDGLEPCIAAASIVAKVTRDRLMIAHAQMFPAYGFERHKGYGAPDHIACIRTNGITPLHRRSYLTRILTEDSSPSIARG
jgi:ribonuclease HII